MATQFNEKSGLLNKIERKEERPQRKRQYALKVIVVALILSVWWSATVIESLLSREPRRRDPDTGSRDQWDFQDITPSEKLEWHPCYGSYKCARLTVPMDYHRPLNASNDNPKVYVAVVLIPGASEKRSVSPLLLNPGGPGGSGVGIALGLGRPLQEILGADQDIIGFDPRGIGATTPRTDCFAFPNHAAGEDDYMEGLLHRVLWQNSGREIGLVNSSEVALQKIDVRARALGQQCGSKDALSGNNSIFKYVSTPNVARDMISIIDAWDEWRGDEDETDAVDTAGEAGESETSHSLDTKGKLVYWGFSYGTLLGATFAAMFPDRVGRVVLDGVVDADYYVSPAWSDSLRDTDTILESFHSYCHAAGEKCALFREGDKVADIKDRFQGVLAKIKKDPIISAGQPSSVPSVLYESDIRRLLFSTMYSPTAMFPYVANLLNQLDNGDFEAVPHIMATVGRDLDFFCGEPLSPQYLPNEATFAIMCSDKRYPLNGTLPDLEKLFTQMANTSSFADVWMSLMVGCDAWPIESKDPPMRWDDHPAKNPKPIKTSFPVLFVSNTADPVTPLYAGVKMAQKFVDAGLIEQKSEGHCSLAAVSLCTTQKIQAYFLQGKVPPPPVKSDKGLSDGKWDKCEAESWPWHPYDPSTWIAERGDEGEVEVKLMKASASMHLWMAKMFMSRGESAINPQKLFDWYSAQ